MAKASVTWTIFKNWMDKGDASEDQFDKFIYYWIAFNCYYWSVTDATSDSGAVKELATYPDIVKIFNEIISDQTNQNALKQIQKLSPIFNEKEKKSKYAKLTGYTYETVIVQFVYEARNNLFHGNKGITDDRDMEIISACVPIMAQLVRRLYNLPTAL